MEIDAKFFKKLIFIYNCLNDGWGVKKINHKYNLCFSKKGAILPSLFAALFLSLKSAILWFELLVVLNFNLFDYIKCGTDPPYKCSLIFFSEQLFVFIIIVLILGFELAQILVELPNQVKHAKFILILFNLLFTTFFIIFTKSVFSLGKIT